KIKYLSCQAYGISTAGRTAVNGTPSVPFNYGWWTSDGSLRLDGTRFEAPEVKTRMPEASWDPKLDCRYDYNPATRTVAGPTLDGQVFPTRTHAQEQELCPIHLRRH